MIFINFAEIVSKIGAAAIIVAIAVAIIMNETIVVAVGVTAFIVPGTLVLTLRFIIRFICIIPLQRGNYDFRCYTVRILGALIVVSIPLFLGKVLLME